MPRKHKAEKHRGVFERVKGSNIWWIRYTNEQGKRVTSKVGTYSAAVHVYEQRTAAIRLGVLLPNSPRRGIKFSELVADAISFAEKHHRASKDFKQRANLALESFADRVAESITTRELQNWIDEMSEEREWTAGNAEPNQIHTEHRIPRRHEGRQGSSKPRPADSTLKGAAGTCPFSVFR